MQQSLQALSLAAGFNQRAPVALRQSVTLCKVLGGKGRPRNDVLALKVQK